MKKFKPALWLTLALFLSFNLSQSQNRIFRVHQDNVRPSMAAEYEKIQKEFSATCAEHNVDANWLAVSTDNFTYMYVSEIENFADLDKRPFADMAEAMGDSFGEIFDRFDKCYDSHGDYLIVLSDELSYMPDGMSLTQEGMNYRNFYYLYHTPENYANLRDAMKAVKDMFAEKGSKMHYRVYHTAFGVMDSYFMVAVSSKDDVDSATRGKENTDVLGPDRGETFGNMMKYVSKFEEYTGNIRQDLSYSGKNE
jgi:hypothetical protein